MSRKENDALGSKEIPDETYWGIHTQRALENFPVSAVQVPRGLIEAFVLVKKAAAQSNLELGFLDDKKAGAIIAACDELLAGRHADQFPLDALQGGAGTSTNMNVNEVIANLAIETLGGQKGQYDLVHPIEHVNLHQSTNDVYPTALKMAAIFALRRLSENAARLQGVFQKKEKEFADVIKVGRTEMREAVPMTLGGEFGAFAEGFARDRWRTFKCEERLRVVNIGGTAIGTGLGAPRSYIFLVIEKLRQLSGLGLTRSDQILDATANADAFVEVSGILKAHAANLIKIANDLRLLSLLKEIILPEVQAGSSIMPGKVNPVILESVIQAGMRAIANDAIVTQAASDGTLQINEFLPVLGLALLESLEILISSDGMLAAHTEGITANREVCRYHLERSETIVTAFLPHIGYDRAGELLKAFKAIRRENLREYLEEQLGKDLVEKVLSPHNLMSLGYRDHENNT